MIASVLDGVRASGNRDVCVRMTPTDRGYRFGPFTVPVDEEVESQHLKFVSSPPGKYSKTFKYSDTRKIAVIILKFEQYGSIIA